MSFYSYAHVSELADTNVSQHTSGHYNVVADVSPLSLDPKV